MNYLALDIGLRRTGVAFADDSIGVPVSLETLHHHGIHALFDAVEPLVQSRHIDHVVVGLPLLPSGKEGEQCAVVHAFCSLLDQAAIPYSTVDERYTSFQSNGDTDASAANQLLLTYLEQNAL